jgi:hypothetical protein
MAGRVGVLGTERGAKREDSVHCLAVCLDVQLARHGEVGGFAKEVFFIVYHAGLSNLLQIERRNLEHRARAFCVRRRYERRVDILKIALLEELMNSKSHAVSYALYGTKRVRPRPQVGLIPQEFEGVCFLLQGITFRGGFAYHRYGDSLNLHFLPCRRGWNEVPLDGNARTGRGFFNLIQKIAKIAVVLIENALNICEARTVIHLNKNGRLCLTLCSDPTPYGHGLSFWTLLKNLFYCWNHHSLPIGFS